MNHTDKDTLCTRKTLTVEGKKYDYFSLEEAAHRLGDLSRLPFSLKVLLENLLRFEDGQSVTVADIKAVHAWLEQRGSDHEIAFRPARVLMQDFTGVPAVVDLAAMREAMVALGGDPSRINPLTTANLVIDHSVMVDEFGTPRAFQDNVRREFERNGERYAFLRWGQQAFTNFQVVPPGTGICHQVNLEYLAQTVWVETQSGEGYPLAYPDTLVGTDSHTTMINGLAVLGWGVGGIEAEAAMLGQPVSMLIPEVVGVRLDGKLREGATATDLVLTVTQMLRKQGVVGKFVEFYGPGLDHLPLADRATIANMAPEYGATCGFFPIDEETLRYLTFSGRDPHQVRLVETYAKTQGLWRESDQPEPSFTAHVELDLSKVEPSLAGPRRPQDRIPLSAAAGRFADYLTETNRTPQAIPVVGTDYALEDGHVVIAAITSCTNTSNPSVMLAAGLLARNAVARGLQVKPWVKTSLAPGSQVVTDYLQRAGLQTALNTLGFDLVGYGCTTCIGNSGPLPEPIAAAVEAGDLSVCGVLSGNRNFEGRINPLVKANYLASPPLVVTYALAGSLKIDLYHDPIGQDTNGQAVYLRDLWPSSTEVQQIVADCLTPEMFRSRYANVFEGSKEWQEITVASGQTYPWDKNSTYVRHPPFFTRMRAEPDALTDIQDARCLALLGDSVTTDHISPAGSIKPDSPAGRYLIEHGVQPVDFNSYGARRGNHEVMMRGTFANIRIHNEMLPGVEGGLTIHIPSGEQLSIYDAAMRYQEEDTPLVIVAGKEYGTGSSRDWAAKGTYLLGVRAVIAESFERIHRSNLIGMGVLPLQFPDGTTRKTLDLDGTEYFSLDGVANGLQPRAQLKLMVRRADGQSETVSVLCRIDTLDELAYFRNGGILQYVLRTL